MQRAHLKEIIVGILGKLFGKKEAPQEPPGVGMRMMALRTSAVNLGFYPDDDFPSVYGVLTDWNIGDVTASIVAMRDGTASLYTTSTFGIIGGHGHEEVRQAAARCVKLAESFAASGEIVTEFPYPKGNLVYLYILAYDGVRRCVGNESALEQGSDPTLPLFEAAQEVLTHLRLITEKENG